MASPAEVSVEVGAETKFAPNNVLTIAGILKCVELLFGIVVAICVAVFSTVVIICVAVSADFYEHQGGGWVLFVAAAASLITIALLVMYLFNFIAKVPTWWTLAEFIYYSVFTGLYVTACIVCANANVNHTSVDAATVFSFFAFVVYHLDSCLKYHDYMLPIS